MKLGLHVDDVSLRAGCARDMASGVAGETPMASVLFFQRAVAPFHVALSLPPLM